MTATLTDEDLTRLFGEAAEAFEVPDEGSRLVLAELPEDAPRPVLRRRWVQLSAAAAAVVVAVLVAQNFGSGVAARTNLKASADAPVGGASGHAPLAPVSGGSGASVAGGTTGGSTSTSAGGAADQYSGRLAHGPVAAAVPQAAPAPPAARGPLTAPGVPTAAGAGTTVKTGPLVDGGDARVVKTGTVTLMVDHGKVSPTVKRVQSVVVGARGYVSDQSTQELGSNPTATVTMRVPVASFETVVQQVRDIGAKVVSVESSGKDVTATYADTAAQIASLKAARGRFLTILSGAKTIGETLTVQQRVDDVQSQIDRLEGQRRVLQNQSDLATLTVTVSEKADAILRTAEPSGLSKAWDRATHGFTSGVEGLIARSGRALLVLIVLLVGFVVLRLGWRLARRRLV